MAEKEGATKLVQALNRTASASQLFTSATDSDGSAKIRLWDSSAQTARSHYRKATGSFVEGPPNEFGRVTCFTAFEWDPGNLGDNSTTLFYTGGGTTSAITLIGGQVASSRPHHRVLLFAEAGLEGLSPCHKGPPEEPRPIADVPGL